MAHSVESHANAAGLSMATTAERTVHTGNRLTNMDDALAKFDGGAAATAEPSAVDFEGGKESSRVRGGARRGERFPTR